MKRLAFPSLVIATLIAPIQVQAQQYDPAANCVRFPQKPNPDAELQYLLSHPGDRVCPGPNSNPAGQSGALQQGARDRSTVKAMRAAHDTGAEPLQPVRAWLRAQDIPPIGAGAYGLIVFHSKPTPASRQKLKMVCAAFVAFFPRSETATVPLEDQMITVWPLDNPETKEAKEDNCDYALDHYELVSAETAISDAQLQHATFDGAGPYLVGWSPSKARGVPDALVLVVDMSADNSQAAVDAKFLFWKNKIVQDPLAWRGGFSIERVRVAIHNFSDQYGQAMLDAIKLVGVDKKP